MKAAIINKTGGPEVIELKDIVLEKPGKDEVSIEQKAIGLNYIDTYHRSGLYKLKLPSGIGMEGAGEVIEIGSEVKNFNKGDKIGLVGKNGAGKSTLVKSMFGLVEVRNGVVQLLNEEITNLAAHELVRKGVGYVPQTENVFPSLTISENLQMGAYQLKPTEVLERVKNITDLFPKLGQRIKQRAGLLSGGERQMLAMGRALMMEPSVLLLDEPSAGLSPALQVDVFENVTSINKTGVSIVMVEQNAKQALSISDRGYVLVTGENKFEGSGKELLNDPEVRRSFLGA